MKKSIMSVVVVTSCIMAADAIAGSWHIFNDSSYTLTVTPEGGSPVKVSAKKVTSKVVGSNASSWIIGSTPVKAKITTSGKAKSGTFGLEYGKVDGSGNFVGTPTTIHDIPKMNGDPVMCIDVGMVSPKGKIKVRISSMGAEDLSGYLRQE